MAFSQPKEPDIYTNYQQIAEQITDMKPGEARILKIGFEINWQTFTLDLKKEVERLEGNDKFTGFIVVLDDEGALHILKEEVYILKAFAHYLSLRMNTPYDGNQIAKIFEEWKRKAQAKNN